MPVLTMEPTSPDPLKGKFDLAKASAGLPKGKALWATLDTGYGTIECTLYADKTPKTVANFVGLARGLRPFWDAKAAAWVKRPLFDGTSFHRAIAGFMIQGGDHLGNGTGQVGYVIPDEIVGSSTIAPASCAWPTAAPTPTAVSSSSPTPRRRT
jgi:peptidyl-prolyl cis-trans isomerase A (cyclophilin A)